MKKPIIPAKAMLPLGSFLITGTFLLSHDWIKMPDLLTGSLTGLGIGIMIVGGVKMYKRKNELKNPGADSVK